MSDSNRFKIPPLYKKLLGLVAVIGPIYWLMLTDDGRRRTDLVVLSLMGNPEVELRLDTLASAATEQQVQAFLPDVQWQCSDTPSAFGERHCLSPIAGFNATPAHYLVMYYTGGALQAMKVAYRPAYHGWLVAMLHQMLGQPDTGEAGVLQWDTGRGVVLLQQTPAADDAEPTLLWLAAQRAASLP